MASQIPVLKIFIDNDDNDLKKLYQTHVEKHNNNINQNYFSDKTRKDCDAGFDLFVPEDVTFSKDELFRTKKLDSQIKAELCSGHVTSSHSCAYYLYARSSISKTPLMLANHVGIVDSGYRGHLIGAVRCMYMESEDSTEYKVEKFTRLFQICQPSLEPFYVEIVAAESELSGSERGSGGFGSTGLVGARN
jgi:dUTP pyrophosphatase